MTAWYKNVQTMKWIVRVRLFWGHEQLTDITTTKADRCTCANSSGWHNWNGSAIFVVYLCNVCQEYWWPWESDKSNAGARMSAPLDRNKKMQLTKKYNWNFSISNRKVSNFTNTSITYWHVENIPTFISQSIILNYLRLDV